MGRHLTRQQEKAMFAKMGNPNNRGINSNQRVMNPNDNQKSSRKMIIISSNQPTLRLSERKFISDEISRQRREGQPQRQSIAIAFSKARKKFGSKRIPPFPMGSSHITDRTRRLLFTLLGAAIAIRILREFSRRQSGHKDNDKQSGHRDNKNPNNNNKEIKISLRQLRKLRSDAIKQGKDRFFVNGKPILVSFSKFMIQFIEMENKRKGLKDTDKITLQPTNTGHKSGHKDNPNNDDQKKSKPPSKEARRKGRQMLREFQSGVERIEKRKLRRQK